MNRCFRVDELGKVWVPEITYLKVMDKWYYVTTMIDLADRKIVGYSISDNLMTQATVIAAWNNARSNRAIQVEFLLHSDRGVLYVLKEFTTILKQNRYANQIMSRKGNCWENTVAESFFKSLKCELINHQKFIDSSHLKLAVAQYIWWYNHKRLHQSLNYLTPVEMEQLLLNNFKKVA